MLKMCVKYVIAYTLFPLCGFVMILHCMLQVENHHVYLRPGRIFSPCNIPCPAHTSKKQGEYRQLSQNNFKDRVIIMTPISNSARYLDKFIQNVCCLDYPHENITVAFGEDSSLDNSLAKAQGIRNRYRSAFRDIKVISLSNLISHKPLGRLKEDQYERRKSLAFSRNALLNKALTDEKWVLWLDSDVEEYPPDIIQRLISVDKDVVVPSCLFYKDKSIGLKDVYDRNTWIETEESLRDLESKPVNFLMLEGYGKSKRLFLPDVKDEGQLVEVDGVGGCVLLIRADCHRKGLIFPPVIYKNHIETEGLAKLAKDMGFGVYGLPNVEVFHS